jgi:hypothetical protein
MTLASPKRVRTRHREVDVKQIDLDLGVDHAASAPTLPLPSKVQDALVGLMAAAIIAVHQATQEAGDDDRGSES